MFFRTKRTLVKMKDKVEVERSNYLTTSSLGGEEKCILAQYNSEQRAMEILNKIDDILDKAITDNKSAISINIPSN